MSKLTYKQVRKTYSPVTIKVKEIDRQNSLKGIIGQERAVKALRFGLCIHQPGFNIYV